MVVSAACRRAATPRRRSRHARDLRLPGALGAAAGETPALPGGGGRAPVGREPPDAGGRRARGSLKSGRDARAPRGRSARRGARCSVLVPRGPRGIRYVIVSRIFWRSPRRTGPAAIGGRLWYVRYTRPGQRQPGVQASSTAETRPIWRPVGKSHARFIVGRQPGSQEWRPTSFPRDASPPHEPWHLCTMVQPHRCRERHL
jgi:hypothetical protein